MATKAANKNGKSVAPVIGDAASNQKTLTISAPKLATIVIDITGTAPLVINKMSARAKQKIRETQEAGSVARGKKIREAKDFEQIARESAHVSEGGWYGIHAAAFRNAMIDACRMCGIKMVHAKMSVFIVADGLDRDDGTPLVRIHSDEPEVSVLPVKNATGVVDLRPRMMWRRWSAKVRISYDEDQFHVQDVVNLLHRAGVHCGVGEGRPFSRESAGCGWGTFTVETK